MKYLRIELQAELVERVNQVRVYYLELYHSADREYDVVGIDDNASVRTAVRVSPL